MPQPSPAGLKPTIRQSMILVVWVALLAAGARLLIRHHVLGDQPAITFMIICAMVPLYPMLLLAGLLWLLDRPGPVRRWYMALCVTSTPFLVGLLGSLALPFSHALAGRPSLNFPMFLIIGLFCISFGWLQWRTARPRRCPLCRRLSVIPVPHPLHSRRSTATRGWCSVCGAEFEREDSEDWRVAQNPASPPQPGPPPEPVDAALSPLAPAPGPRYPLGIGPGWPEVDKG